jgi:hypothetical protein
MMERKKIQNLKTNSFFGKKEIISFVNVETDPRLLVVQAKNSDS